MKKYDKFVSQSIVKTGAWEPDNVHKLMEAVSLYKDAVFLSKHFVLSWWPPWAERWLL